MHNLVIFTVQKKNEISSMIRKLSVPAHILSVLEKNVNHIIDCTPKARFCLKISMEDVFVTYYLTYEAKSRNVLFYNGILLHSEMDFRQDIFLV